MRLLNRRIERNAHLLESMRDSKNLSDLLSVQQEWLHESTKDYFEQMQKMGGLLWELGEGSTRNARENMPSSSSWTAGNGQSANGEHRAAA